MVGQVSKAGSAIATLQKELSSTSAQKIIKPVKAPSPSRKTVETRMTPAPTPSPFKDTPERYEAHFDTQLQKQIGPAFAEGIEQKHEDWEQQVCGLSQSRHNNNSVWSYTACCWLKLALHHNSTIFFSFQTPLAS